MFYIKEALHAYNWFVALAMSYMGNGGLSNWTARAKVKPSEGELELVRLESKNDNIDLPFNITIEHNEKPLYHIHLYVDEANNWQDNLDSDPLVINLRTGISGITPIKVAVVHKDMLTFKIDSDKFDSKPEMFFRMKNYYSKLFEGICNYPNNYYGLENSKLSSLFEILANIYLARFTIYDIDECFDFTINKFKEIDTLKKSFGTDFLAIFIDPERCKKKAEFMNREVEKDFNYLKELTKSILEEYTDYLNPQIKRETDFINSYANNIDYEKYRDKYEDVKLEELIGPDPIPV